LAGLGVGCGSSAPLATPTSTPATAKPAQPGGLTLTPANSELVVGANRFALGILLDGRPVPDASVALEFFQVSGQTATKRAETMAIYRTIGDSPKGVYVSRVNFDQAGAWGVQATVIRSGQPSLSGRTSFEVLAQSSTPVPGQRAIASRNPTAREVPSLDRICSAQPPCSLHELSLADALGAGKPLLIAFATPGYCTSQTCAPVLYEVLKVAGQRGGVANFVHVEIYSDPRTLTIAPTVNEWGLRSEPWVFLVDRGGTIVDRIESVTNAAELDAALAPLL
jgi:YtkA-like protein